MKYFINHSLFYIHLCTFAITFAQVPGLIYLGRPVYNTGSYWFLACEESEGLQLVDLFNQMQQFIQEDIIPDARQGSASIHGFSSMFSTNSGGDVAKIFQDIHDKAPRSSVSGRAIFTPLLIICANPAIPNQNLQQMVSLCNSAERPYVTKPEWDIYVCPYFFKTNANLPTASECPLITPGKSQFLAARNPNAEPILQHRISTLFYQLSRKFSSEAVAFDAKLWALNDCLKAAPNIQVGNGNNFAYYASCKSSLSPRPN